MADSKRTKIKVISVGTPKEVGDKGAKVTQFKGVDLSTNEEGIFECWSSALLEEIKPEAEIDADVVHTVNETSSGIYEHNKVTQVYKDGQPVKPKPGGWRGSDDSPEKRASIESQKAAELIINLRIAGVIDDKDNLYKKALDWCGTVLQPTSITIKPEAQASIKPGEVPDQVIPVEPGPELDFDPDKLLEELNQVHWKDATVKSYLKNVYRVDTEGSVVNVVARLTPEDREKFFAELADRLQMA